MSLITDKVLILKKLLKDKKPSIATAESCTGGLLGATLTEKSGATAFYLGGVIAYDNSVKIALLGVKADTLKRYGAVSKQTSIEMAQGITKKLRTSKTQNIIAVSITGIAGPNGGTVKKPLGTVFITVKLNKYIATNKFNFKGSRDKIRHLSALSAVEMSIEALKKYNSD